MPHNYAMQVGRLAHQPHLGDGFCDLIHRRAPVPGFPAAHRFTRAFTSWRSRDRQHGRRDMAELLNQGGSVPGGLGATLR